MASRRKTKRRSTRRRSRGGLGALTQADHSNSGTLATDKADHMMDMALTAARRGSCTSATHYLVKAAEHMGYANASEAALDHGPSKEAVRRALSRVRDGFGSAKMQVDKACLITR